MSTVKEATIFFRSHEVKCNKKTGRGVDGKWPVGEDLREFKENDEKICINLLI
ncbi:hypothetical protein R4Z10_10415 [Niallia sp. XMNu-256]|uniref:hypothetical protein n=1 Tax=Niallia sp. XMNu-256 TaxID=3082444 RepID=UPI0030CFEEC5